MNRAAAFGPVWISKENKKWEGSGGESHANRKYSHLLGIEKILFYN